MRPLWPPLAVIESNLFASSEFEIISEEKSGSETIETMDIEVPPMPTVLSELIQKRVATQTTTFSPIPTPGQILLINPNLKDRKTKDGLEGIFNASKRNKLNQLTILLDKPTHIKNSWAGWIVAAETDYASYWDMLLEPEDEPYDPLAGMIQIWNPIQIAIPANAKVLAELKPIRLQAVRALADEYETGRVSPDEKSLPGHIAPRDTLGNFSVLTGTILGETNTDSRHDYQILYHQVAQAIAVVELQHHDFIKTLKEFYQKWLKLLPPEQMVPTTLAVGVILGLLIPHLTTTVSDEQLGEEPLLIPKGSSDTPVKKTVSEEVEKIIADNYLYEAPPAEWIDKIIRQIERGKMDVAIELIRQFQIHYPHYAGE